MMPMSFEIFAWNGIRPGDEIEVLDDGLVVARGVIEDLTSDHTAICGSRSPTGKVNEHPAARTDGKLVLFAGIVQSAA